MWDGKLGLDIGVTNYCNARCPQCDRTNVDGCGVEDNIGDLKHMTFAEFKEWFDVTTLKNIRNFNFSGIHGDPFMNPEIFEMIDYALSNKVIVSFSTNGSMRSDEFWWELGLLASKHSTKLIGTFDVDGIVNETHTFYRRGTDLAKVMSNAETFAATSAETNIFMVVFKHNEHEIDAVGEWANSIGASFEPHQSGRFSIKPIVRFSEDGVSYQLEMSDFKGNSKRVERNFDERENQIANSTYADCSWNEANRLMVDVSGRVWPCCYVESIYYNRKPHLNEGQWELIDWFGNNKNTNLHNGKLLDIIRRDEFQKFLPERLTNNPFRICKIFCGKCE